MTSQSPAPSTLPALHVPEGRPAWVHYLDYLVIGRTFDDLTPDSVPDAVALARRAAGVELPSHFETVQFNLWVLLRRGYWMPELTDDQRERLAHLLSLTHPTNADDDTPLAPEGAHRALHTFLVRELGERIPETRGAVYALASAYVGTDGKPAKK